MITFVTTAYQETYDANQFISCLMLQTDPRWKCIIYCDEPNDYIKNVVNTFNDERITYVENNKSKGFWGHHNRQYALDQLVKTDFVIQTSIQDYYIPTTVAEILTYKDTHDFIFFNLMHHSFEYSVLNTRIEVCYIDWGSFAVRTSLAKQNRINNPESKVCDGLFAEECSRIKDIRVFKINKTLTIHN
jgi:hypothetical protein